MTLDQSLANLQQQADRLAAHFSAISDRIEAGSAPAPADFHAVGAAVKIADGTPSNPMPTHWGFDGPGEAQAVADDFAPEPSASAPVPQSGVAADGTPIYAPPVNADGVAPPWEAQAAAEQPAEKKPAKKGGRRTNEELAADAGVSLDAVKAWLGEGQRVTKAAIEEYAAKHASAGAQPPNTEPAAPPFDNGGQLPQQGWPAAEPVTQAPPAQQWPPTQSAQQAEGFQEWGGAQKFDPSNPFGS